MQSTQEMKQSMEKLGYYGTDELALTMRLLFSKEISRDGITSVCLTGLPGVGKTFLPKTMANLFNYTYIDYTCHLKTGPEQLVEDMNIPAMVRKDADNSVTKGAITRAIEAVNRGEDVILVIDEFDKAARETDYYFLEFLQDGKIETNSFGKLRIQPEDFNKLTVFVCKNDERDVHEALMRRFSKFIELEAPDVRTVQTILTEEVPEADRLLLNAALSMYQTIVSDAKDYKKLATIQEMKNALREDVMLIKFEESEKNRLKNLVNHMTKFPEDRMLLRAKLKDNGLMELDDHAKEQEEYQLSEEALEKFYMNNVPQRIHDLEIQLHQMQQKMANGLVAASAGESDQAIRVLADAAPQFEEGSVVEHITALGTLTSESLMIAGSLPKSTYNPSIMPLTKKPAAYADEQYIIAELRLNRRNGKLSDLMEHITSVKSQMDVFDVTYDGFILTKEDYNQIGFLHVMETEGMPPRMYLVSAKPVITDEQFHKAINSIPRSIRQMTDVVGLDVNIVTEKEFHFVARSLDHVYTLSEDHTQVVGNKNGVIVRYDSDEQLMKLKITSTKSISTDALRETAIHIAASTKEKVTHSFNERMHVVSLQDVYNSAIASGQFKRLGKGNEVLSAFESDRIEGVNVRLFAKNDMDEVYGLESNQEAEEFVAASLDMEVEDFRKQYAILQHDGDNSYKIYLKDEDEDQNSYWVNYDDEHGSTIQEFIENRKPQEEKTVSSVVEKAEALSRTFILNQQSA